MNTTNACIYYKDNGICRAIINYRSLRFVINSSVLNCPKELNGPSTFANDNALKTALPILLLKLISVVNSMIVSLKQSNKYKQQHMVRSCSEHNRCLCNTGLVTCHQQWITSP